MRMQQRFYWMAREQLVLLITVGAHQVVHVRFPLAREVIVSGGTINSPQLLQLSGIGPKKLLADLGIDTRHNLNGVGENLRDHYGTRLTARAKNVSTINELARGPRLIGEIAKYFIGKSQF